jgi:hypothetical protein
LRARCLDRRECGGRHYACDEHRSKMRTYHHFKLPTHRDRDKAQCEALRR